jgi:replicative superfamily II helicase
VKVTSEREIDVELLRMGNDWHGEVLGALQGHGCRKVLCFFNARSSSEKAAKLLDRPPFQGRVWVHHGSLNKEVREAVEERMNKEKTGLLCCTSTLELGIDIGDIDAVVLVRPPFNVSSLLQRLGRGNRRRQSYLRVLGLHVNEWEKFLFETFLECARNGHLYEKRYTPSLSVIPQQLLSYAFQRRRIGMTRESARRALAPLVSRDESFNLIFRHMVETGKLVAEREGIYQTGVDVERQVASGKIHSNIQDKSFGEYEVVEQTTGRKVGAVFFVFHHFMLGGRSWELVQRDEKRKRLLVRPLAAVTTHTQVFEGTGTGGYSYRLAPILKARLFPELEPDEFPYFREGRETMLLHLLGPTYGFILSEALSGRAMDVSDMDGKLFMLTGNAGRGLGTFPIPEAAAIREVIRGSLARLEDNLGSGAFFRLLPEELQVEDHMLTLDVEGLLAYMRGLSVVELPAEQVTAAIRSRLGSAPAD